MFRVTIKFFRDHLALTIILTGFLLLSSTGLFYNFGLATAVNDETPPLVAALKMIADQTLRPAYPTFYYLPVAAYAELPFAILALLFTWIAVGADAIRDFVILDFAKLLPWARLASMFYGALALVVFYHIARRIFTEKHVALLAVFFFATSSLFIQLAHFGRVWTIQMLAFTLALWAILRLFDEPYLRRYLVVAGAIALSFGINMVGALVYMPFAVAHFLRMKGASMGKILFECNFLIAHAALFSIIALFYFLNPYGFENYITYIKRFLAALTGSGGGITQVALSQNPNFCGEGSSSALTYYFRILFTHETPLTLFAFLGTATLWYRGMKIKKEDVIILGSFFFAYLVGITILSVVGIANCEQRYILPVIPIMALLGALGVATLFETISGKLRVLLALLIFTAVLYGPIMFDVRLALPATRMEAREWILHDIPDGSNMVNFDERLELPENFMTLERVGLSAAERMTVKRTYLLANPAKISMPAYFIFHPAFGSYGEGEDYEYLIISWWNKSDREAQMEKARSVVSGKELTLIQRFPHEATENTQSVDLGNNVGTLRDLWVLKQSGPTVDIFLLR